MAGNRDDMMARLMPGVANAAAALAARKAVVIIWTKVTSHDPPVVEDRKVPLGQALAWALLVGAAASTARLITGRLISRVMPAEADESAR